MIIKIGNAVFDTNGDYPIMLIMSQEEKSLISRMKENIDRICFAPSDWSEEKINNWMGGDELETPEKNDEK